MADWSTPTLTSSYSDFLTQVKARDTDLALQFDGTTSTSLTTGTIRWDSTDNRWKKWNGTSWAELTSSYNLNSLTLPNGTANGVAYLNGSKVLTTGSALTFDGTKLVSPGVQLATSTNLFNVDSALSYYPTNSVYLNGSSSANQGLALNNNGTNSTQIFLSSNQSITFGVNNAEQMRLTSTGLGIGTSSPSYKLDVQGTSPRILVKSTSTGYAVSQYENSGNRFWLGVDDSTGSGYTGIPYAALLYSNGAYPMVFWTNGAERMRLDSSGNLGLGVTPSAWYSNRRALQIGTTGIVPVVNFGGVNGMSTYNSYIDTAGTYRYQNTGPAAYHDFNISSNGGYAWAIAPSGTAGAATSFTQAMTLDASGNLGVGYSTPSNFNAIQTAGQAYVFGPGTGSPAITLFGSSSGTGRVAFAKGLTGNDQYRGFIEYGYSSDYMAFITGASERMRISSNGSLLVGTTANAGGASISASFINSNGGGIQVGQATLGGGAIIGNTNSGLLFYGYTGSQGSETYYQRMVIDSSGNVGIGTSSPSFSLSVTPSTNGTAIKSGNGCYVSAYNGDAAIGNSSLSSSGSWYAQASTGAIVYAGSSGMQFFTNSGLTAGNAYSPTERMRIDSSGNLLVGTTTNLYARAGFANAGNCITTWNSGGTSGYFDQILFFNNQGTTSVGSIQRVNNSTVQYNTSSDYRLKENIQPMTGALEKVAQLNPVTYTWKEDGSNGQGFIAHELQAVVPDCVTGEKDAVDAEGKPVYQGIDTSFLVATLTKAIQEQQEQINQLKAEVAALKGK